MCACRGRFCICLLIRRSDFINEMSSKYRRLYSHASGSARLGTVVLLATVLMPAGADGDGICFAGMEILQSEPECGTD